MMALKAKEHLQSHGSEGVPCLRGHSTQGQAPAMLGSYLGSQLCFLHDVQFFGEAKFTHCHGFKRAELYPLSK